MKATVWKIASFTAFLSSTMLALELFQVSRLPGSGPPPLDKDMPYVIRIFLVLAIINLASIIVLGLLGQARFFATGRGNDTPCHSDEKTVPNSRTHTA